MEFKVILKEVGNDL